MPDVGGAAGGAGLSAARWLLQVPHEGPDRLARLAATALGAEGGRVTVVGDREVLLGSHGAGPGSLPCSGGQRSLCALVVARGEPVVVPDARPDRLEAGADGADGADGAVGAYLAVPLEARGEVAGCVWVCSARPRAWSAHDVELLRELSASISAELQAQVLAVELADAGERIRVAFDAAGFGSFEWDLATDEVRSDVQHRLMFGLPPAPAPVRFEHLYERVHPQDRAVVGRAVSSAVRSGLYAVDHRIVRPDGTVRWVAARGRVGGDDPRGRQRLVGAVHDTTDARDVNALVARELQSSMLTELPDLAGLQLAATYLPAARGHQIGGDWYDAFGLPDGSCALVIGDVSGHDTRAAATMGAVRNLLRGLAFDHREPPSVVLRRLDEAVEGLGMDTLVTLLMARLDPVSGTSQGPDGARVLRWSSAGHPPPVLVHPDGRAQVLATAADLLVGVDARSQRTDQQCALAPGATLLLYSDGLVERRGEDIADGTARLLALAQGLAPAPLERLLAGVVEGLVAPGAEDDTALLAVRLS
ncbi:PAS fold-containing protein [Quadrisphaera sp. DSM 44207]|nr:PAS fold-containing protein [Quadrisphaera sp. DSM 44207]